MKKRLSLTGCIDLLHCRRRASKKEPEEMRCHGGEGRQSSCDFARDPLSLESIPRGKGCCIRPVPYRTREGDPRRAVWSEETTTAGPGTCMDVGWLREAVSRRGRSPLYPDLPLTLAQVNRVCERDAGPHLKEAASLPLPQATSAQSTVVAFVGRGHTPPGEASRAPPRPHKGQLAELLWCLLAWQSPVMLIYQHEEGELHQEGEVWDLAEILRHSRRDAEAPSRLQLVDLRGSSLRNVAVLRGVVEACPSLLWLGLARTEIDAQRVSSLNELLGMEGGAELHQLCLDRQIQITFHSPPSWEPTGIYVLALPVADIQRLRPREFSASCAAAVQLPGLAGLRVSPSLLAGAALQQT